MRGRVVLSVGLMLVGLPIIVAGCSSGGGSASATPTPVPSATPTASPVPTPAPVPTPTPFAPTTFTLTAPYNPSYAGTITARVKWPTTNLKVFLDTGTDPRSATNLKSTLLAGFEWWKTAMGSALPLTFTWTDVASEANIKVKFVDSDPNIPAGSGEQGFATFAGTGGTPRSTLTTATITLLSNLPDSKLVPLAAHEMGHALGLGPEHSTDSGDIMYSVLNYPGALTQRDANTLAYLYLTDLP